MGLTKYKIKELITIVYEKNDNGIRDFYGININKEFIPTVANTKDLDEKKYKVVRKGRFVYSGMQTGRDECIRLSMYTKDKPIVVSPAYITFEVTKTDKIVPLYFFVYFLSTEKDRRGWFYSDGSVRANLDWDVFGDIEIEIPSINIQKKYVNIYNAMVANQQSYERGLEDLKLTFETLIDKYKYVAHKKCIGELLQEIDCRNEDNSINNVQGINIMKQFIPSVADTTDANLQRYKIVRNGQFAYSGMQTGRDESIRIALYSGNCPIIISPAYSVLQVKSEDALPEYIMMWFFRDESNRRGWFMSDASIRANLDLDRFFETEIPIPERKIQDSIVKIYNTYKMRHEINEKLKAQIKELCPILIKGSLQ
ncbi:MAG: restriction endonuclease subunit S [Eubacterium sp.]|nr:restriction endonuclease subunit S [Eubacterium sp.]